MTLASMLEKGLKLESFIANGIANVKDLAMVVASNRVRPRNGWAGTAGRRLAYERLLEALICELDERPVRILGFPLAGGARESAT